MTDLSTTYTPPPTTSTASNPLTSALTAFTDFLGSANVQKILGMVQTGIAGATSAEGKSFAMHLSGMTVGGVFTLGVHVVDAIRAWIAKK